jgi:Transposase IS66 family.
MECPVEPDREQAYQRRIATLEAQLSAALQRLAELEAEVARLKKNSSNSSKPPSSDIVKPPKPAPPQGGQRKIGGQPGHERHLRAPFTAEQIDRVVPHTLTTCPACGGKLTPAKVSPRVIQQVELAPRLVEVTEHRGEAFYCRHCDQIHYAPLPAAVEQGGLLGPELTALVGYLKGMCHTSFSTIRKLLRDVFQVTISRGQLVKVINKAAVAMAGAYDQLRALLPAEAYLNVDETGHKAHGKPWWTWCFRADLYTLFKIDHSRGSAVLVEMLGKEFDGVLGCDYFSAYHKYMKDFGVTVQFCLAHLIRDVKFLTELPDPLTAAYGQRVLAGLRQLFHVIHRRETMDPARFQRALEKAREELVAVGKRAPPRTEAQTMAKRFREHGADYFRFITTPGVEPTNNLAEQAIRFVVIDRLITQGTRSERGRRWNERIWTAIATCTQQGRSVFEYLRQSILARFTGTPAPSLLPVAA